MAKNEFLPFGTAANANVIPNADYLALPARSSGFSSGVAKSEQLNTVWRQASVIASVVAQFIADNSGQDVLDDGNVTTLKTNLEDALSAITLTRENPFSDIKSDKTESTARSNLGLGTAATYNVGNGANQIPDGSLFVNGTDGVFLPKGVIIQGGVVKTNTSISSPTIYTLPNAYNNKFLSVVGTLADINGDATVSIVKVSNSQFKVSAVRDGVAYAVNVNWIAFGY